MTRTQIEPDALPRPQAHDAERAVLAAMMLSPAAATEGVHLLTPQAFDLQAHANIFRALTAMVERNVPPDLITVCAELERRGELDLAGGPHTLSQILEYASTSANLVHHARIVRETAARRETGRAADRLSEAMRSGSAAVPDALERFRATVDNLPGEVDQPTVTYLDMEQPAPPIEWIVPGWLARREIAVLASSAGSGKSTTVADLCIAVATGRPWCTTLQLAVNQSGPVLYFDEEQGGEEVLRLFQRLYGCKPHPQLHVASMQGIVLSTPAGVSRIEEQIKTLQPRLVVLDTVAQVFAGMDLSKLEEVSAAFRQLFRLRDAYGCTILLLTHYRKASKDENDLMALERVFGSVGFGGNPSTVWTAQRNDGQTLEIRQVKRRGSRTQKIRVEYQENEAGEITLTAESLESAEAEKDRTEVWIVCYLAGKGLVKRGILVSHAVAAGFTERTVARAMNQLCVVGRIERPKYGFWRLVGDDSASEDGKVANSGKVESQDEEPQW